MRVLSFFRTALCSVASVLLILMISGCEHETKPLRLGATEYSGYVPLFFSECNNDFKKQINIIKLPNSTETMRAFRNEIIDIAALTLDEAITVGHYVPDITVFLILNHSSGSDMLLARAPISSVQELKGKKVGVEKSALGSYFLRLILKKSGLNEDELEVVPVLSDRHYETFKKGDVDAIISFEPWASKIKGLGAKSIFDSTMTPFKILDVLVVRQSLLKTHAKQLKMIVDSWDKNTQEILLHKEAKSIYDPEHTHLSIPEYLNVLPGLSIVNKAENRRLLLDEASAFYKTKSELDKTLLQIGYITAEDVLRRNEQQQKSKSIDLLREIYQ